MTVTLLFIILGIILGISIAFSIVTKQLVTSNELGNSTGDRFTYLCSFDLLNARDGVSPEMDIEEM